MRIFMASLATESNTFSPMPTGRAAFEEYGLTRDASRSTSGNASVVLGTWRGLAEAAGDVVTEGLSAFAQPAGTTVRAVYEDLRDQIVADLCAAQSDGAVHMLLLNLHGAMVADGYDDCEGDLLSRLRAAAPDAVIAAELDLHAHLTPAMLAAADLLVAVKEYPHIDAAERAVEVFTLSRRIAQGQLRPVAVWLDTGMVGMYPTFDEPMKSVVADLRSLEGQGGIVSASLIHGFPWADVAEVGTRVLVYADGNADVDASAAAAACTRLAQRLYDLRDALLPQFPDIPTSLDRAAALTGTVVLGDYADNPGGGAAGDSTFFLQALLERDARDAALGCLWDPMAVALCAQAGVGATLPLRLGGKTGPCSGPPLDLTVQVLALHDAHSQASFGARRQLGRSAWLGCGGVDIALCSVRTQVFDPDAFTGLGITLHDKRLVVVKSSSHFEAGFRNHCDHLWRVATPGSLQVDLASLPYTKRDGRFHPRVADPWKEFGMPAPHILPARERG